MPVKTKCDRCNKVKANVELCGDDMLCRACEVQNAAELAKLGAEQQSRDSVSPNILLSNERKCDRCNKLKNNVELCGDEMICRACEVLKAVELAGSEPQSAVSLVQIKSHLVDSNNN